MRKAITVLCTAALTLTMAWGLPQTAASAKTVMKIGHSMPADTFRQKSLVVFKEIVEKETEGRVEVQLYPSGQLGTEMETLEAVKLGSVEGFRSGGFEEAAPLLEIYSMPFLFSDMEGIHKVTRGPLGEEIAKSVEFSDERQRFSASSDIPLSAKDRIRSPSQDGTASISGSNSGSVSDSRSNHTSEAASTSGSISDTAESRR